MTARKGTNKMKKLAKNETITTSTGVKLTGRTINGESILKSADRPILLTKFREGIGSIGYIDQHVTTDEAVKEFENPVYSRVLVEKHPTYIALNCVIHNPHANPTSAEDAAMILDNYIAFTDSQHTTTNITPTVKSFDGTRYVAKNSTYPLDYDLTICEDGYVIDEKTNKTYACAKDFINHDPALKDNARVKSTWDVSNEKNDGSMSDDDYKVAIAHDKKSFPEGIIEKEEWERFLKFAKTSGWLSWDDLVDAYLSEANVK